MVDFKGAFLNLPEPALRLLVFVLAFLMGATAVVFLIGKFIPESLHRELVDRVKAWWIIVGVLTLAIGLSRELTIILFWFISFWALKEYFTAIRTRPEDHLALFVAFFVIPTLQYLWIWNRWYIMFLIFVPVYAFLSIPFFLLISRNPRGFILSSARIHWGLMAFVYGIGHMAYLVNLHHLHDPDAPYSGITLLIYLIFVAEISDVFQYIFGKLFGKHRVWPSISPGKTWEGLIGGGLTATLFGYQFRSLTPFSPPESIFVSLLIVILGFIGGGVMSAMKRDLGKKDFGYILPGHGGIIDRVDSLCWAAPIYFHYIAYFHGHYLLITGARS